MRISDYSNKCYEQLKEWGEKNVRIEFWIRPMILEEREII
jgi:hypothetical protein